MNALQLALAVTLSVFGIAAGIGTLVSILIKYMLIPFLADKFVLLEETHKQVSENSHKNQTPTVLDRIEEVKTQSDRIERLAVDNHDEIMAMARMFDGHLETGQEERDRIQSRVDTLWAYFTDRKNRT